MDNQTIATILSTMLSYTGVLFPRDLPWRIMRPYNANLLVAHCDRFPDVDSKYHCEKLCIAETYQDVE